MKIRKPNTINVYKIQYQKGVITQKNFVMQKSVKTRTKAYFTKQKAF